MLRALLLIPVLWACPSIAAAFPPQEIYGLWEDDVLRAEFREDAAVFTFKGDGAVEQYRPTYEEYPKPGGDGLIVRDPAGGGVLLVHEKPWDGRALKLVFPGAGGTTLRRVATAGKP